MSKTSLVEAVKHFDLEQVRKDLRKNAELKGSRDERGFDLLQLCVSRPTWGDRAAASRQLRLAPPAESVLQMWLHVATLVG